MSASSKLPIGNPNSVSTRSICSGNAPSTSMRLASRSRAINSRLPTKPSHTPTTTVVFLNARPSFRLAASTSTLVRGPRTSSSSGMTWAGLKKCSPTTDAGRRVQSASRSMSSVDVLLPSTASVSAWVSMCRKISCFSPICSYTASITSLAGCHSRVLVSSARRLFWAERLHQCRQDYTLPGPHGRIVWSIRRAGMQPSTHWQCRCPWARVTAASVLDPSGATPTLAVRQATPRTGSQRRPW